MAEIMQNEESVSGVSKIPPTLEAGSQAETLSLAKNLRNSLRGIAGLHPIEYRKNEALALVDRDGEELQNVSKELKDDDAVVMAAVSNNGRALQHASKRLKDKDAVVLTAVSDWGEALEYASERLKADRTVVRMAVAQNGRALRFASLELWGDPDLIQLGNQTYRQRKNHRKE